MPNRFGSGGANGPAPLPSAAPAEQLCVHYTGGQWRAPLSQRALRAGDAPGWVLAADTEDITRALRGLQPLGGGVAALALPQGPFALLTAADTALDRLVDVLGQGARRGVLWKPSPRAAARAHEMMQAHRQDWDAGVALLQGDHATGRALARALPVVWISPRPAPDARWISLDHGATG